MINKFLKAFQKEIKPVICYNSNQIIQKNLFCSYRNLLSYPTNLLSIMDTGFSVYSQNDEDGILLYIFSLIGFTNKICIDIAFGEPDGSNVTNLICNWDFRGLLVDKNSLEKSKEFFNKQEKIVRRLPEMINRWVNAENINKIIEENGIKGEIDLFSLDIDGMDYWVWKNLKIVQPRVVVVEYRSIFDAKTAIVAPYKADFTRDLSEKYRDYFGASLLAFNKLAKVKGYRMIGCNKYGFNAFFIRNDVCPRFLKEVSVSKCLSYAIETETYKERVARVKKFKWVKV